MDPASRLSIAGQCSLLDMSRSAFYYEPRGLSEEEQELMKLIDRIYLERPFLGSRRIADVLWDKHRKQVGRKLVMKLMRIMGIRSLSPGPETTRRNERSRKYPYLLRDRDVVRPNEVWASDITYIPMRRGWIYLVVVMDWHSRKTLSHRISNTMDSDFCVEALEDALSQHGRPEIFNTDQGSQFTSELFTGRLISEGIL